MLISCEVISILLSRFKMSTFLSIQLQTQLIYVVNRGRTHTYEFLSLDAKIMELLYMISKIS
jgi:hypothetical protein